LLLQVWPGDELMDSLAEEMAGRLPPAAAAAAAADNLAQQQVPQQDLSPLTQQQQQQQQQFLQPRTVSTMLWAFASLGYTPQPHTLNRIWAGTAAGLAHAAPQTLSNMLWAAATLDECPSEAWMRGWAAAAAGSLAQWKVVDLAMAAWALGKLAATAENRWATLQYLMVLLLSSYTTGTADVYTRSWQSEHQQLLLLLLLVLLPAADKLLLLLVIVAWRDACAADTTSLTPSGCASDLSALQATAACAALLPSADASHPCSCCWWWCCASGVGVCGVGPAPAGCRLQRNIHRAPAAGAGR
jgi:hypothetical protein